MTRYWLVWVDDTPNAPERPLTLDEAIAEFRHAVDYDATEKVELRQCSALELEWAGAVA